MLGNKISHGVDGRLDHGALNGLRGLFSLHIAFDHIIYNVCKKWMPSNNLYGNVHMPFFYLLSGFSLTLAYGGTLWKEVCVGRETTKSFTNGMENQNHRPSAFALKTFYWNRLIRVLPLYYLATILIM